MEPLDVLQSMLKSERDQPISLPVARQHAPHRRLISEEVPLTNGLSWSPVHADSPPITEILGNGSDGLDAQNGHELTAVIEGQITPPNVGRLDRDTVTGVHRADEVKVL